MISKKLSLSTAIGFGFASALTALNPAQAATVAGCGDAPVGGTLTVEGDFCQATFAPGSSTFTLPDGVSELYGLVVGAGGGAATFNSDPSQWLNPWSSGYAGNGGATSYFERDNLAPNEQLTVEVGTKGTSRDYAIDQNAITAGGESSITGGASFGFGVDAQGGGAAAGSCDCYTTIGSWTYDFSIGSSGTGENHNLGDCQDGEGLPGFNPATETLSRSVFGDFQANLGRGGGLYEISGAAHVAQAGEGANLLLNISDTSMVPTSAQDGIVILRYARVLPVASVPTFAITFDVNGATSGSAPVDASTYFLGSTATVWPKPRFMIKDGYTFTGWNTAADGSGTQYAVGSSLNIIGNVKLFAQWKKDAVALVSSKKISTFVGNSSLLNTAMKRQVATWVRSLPADAQIVCNGSTSGKAVTALDVRLAKARAVNVCKYAVTVRPNVTYKITLSPSSSSDVIARSVWMSLGF